MHKQFLIAFIGPVGSGKTHIARLLAKKLGAIHINTDAIRLKLRRLGKPISRAIALAKSLRREALQRGKPVILDFDAVNPRRQYELRQEAQRFGAKIFLIKIKVPERIIIKRLKARDYRKHDIFRRVYGKSAIGVYFVRKKWHTKKLLAKPDFVINNARPLTPQIKIITKKLWGVKSRGRPLKYE